MIIALFKFILLAVLVVFVMVCMTAFSIFRSFHNISKRHGGFNQNGGQRRSAHESETVIDRRTDDKANRKIFADDEGEYVDFEEDK